VLATGVENYWGSVAVRPQIAVSHTVVSFFSQHSLKELLPKYVGQIILAKSDMFIMTWFKEFEFFVTYTESYKN
jgi:hypothetical protein